MLRSECFERGLVSKLTRGFSPTKKLSEYTRRSLFKEVRPRLQDNNLEYHTKPKSKSPIYWNIKDTDLKEIKSRSRLEDFDQDTFAKLFPKKSPQFNKTKSTRLPPLDLDDKTFNRKIDSITLHREALIRLQKQGFLR